MPVVVASQSLGVAALLLHLEGEAEEVAE